MSDYKRAERVAAQVHATLSQILIEGLADPRLSAVSITGVRVADDLRMARVRVLPLGGEADPAPLLKALSGARGYLRREMGRRMRLRYVPELHFHLDEELLEGVRIVSALSKLEHERGDATADAEGAEGGDEGEGSEE